MSYRISIGLYRTSMSDRFLMSFIVLMSFILSWLLVSFHSEDRTMFHFEKSLYIIKGKVIDVSLRDTTKIVSLEVRNIVSLENNSQLVSIPRYLTIPVSPLNNFQLYDELEVIGEIGGRNNFSNSISSKQNFVPSEHTTEKLFINTSYQVSNTKSITVTQGNFYSKSIWERIKLCFYETSDWIKRRPDNFIKDPYLGIAKGITFGDQENIIKDIRKIFIDSGLIHIMVLSGANVSFIILIFFFLFKKIHYPKFKIVSSNPAARGYLKLESWKRFSTATQVWGTVLASTIFIIGTGLTAPSVRAGVMVNSAFLAEYFSKNFSIKNSILLSLFILTLINPFALVYSASLHLSYLAIVGLVYVVPTISQLIGLKFSVENVEVLSILNVYKSNFWKATFSVFMAITISVGPYLVALSEQINLFGTLATIFLEPIIMGVTVLTFLTTLASFVSSLLAQVLGTLNSFLVSIILHTAEFFAQNIFIINLQINHTFVKIYYLVFIVYFFILNFDSSD